MTMSSIYLTNNIVDVQSLVANETRSALSPKVKHLLCEIGVQENNLNKNSPPKLKNHHVANQNERKTQSAVFSEGFIDFSHCADILPNNSELSVEEYYVRSVAAIAETIKYSHDILECLSGQEFSKTYGEYLLWTKHSKLFQECFELLTYKCGADDHLSLLLLCTGLEYALGNLFLLHGQQCPKMLKDLLAAKVLEDILGCAVIKVLQIVIGPPLSLNIRNVSWHGFLSENELPRRYIFFVLLVTASLGKVLENQGINPGHIITRDYFSLAKAEEISQNLGVPEFSDAEVLLLEEFVVKSWLIGKGNISFFKRAVTHYRHQRFGSCVVLLLPLLEHALRNVFVTVNNCPDRLVTAEATTLYTTFEEILDVSLPDGKENVLVQVLGESCMDLLHDLLIYPNGPRVRDKLGHGEADYHCVPECVAHILLVVLTKLAGLIGDSLETPGRKIVDCLSNYQSVFHPMMVLHQKILHVCTLAAHLHDDLATSPELEPWKSSDGYDVFVMKNSTFASMRDMFTDILDSIAKSFHAVSATEWQHIKHRLLLPFCCVHQDIRSLLPVRLKTLYRWQKDLCAGGSKNDAGGSADCYAKEKSSGSANTMISENEIVGILSRIISETEKTLTQVQSALQVRQEQLVSKQLRSRQRDNMKRLLSFLPCASMLANYIAVSSAWQFCYLGDYQYMNSAELKALQRFLKSTLRTCENLRTFTSGEANKWNEAGQISLSELKSAQKFSQLNIFTLVTKAADSKLHSLFWS